MLQTTMLGKSNAELAPGNQNSPAGPQRAQVMVRVPFIPEVSWPGWLQ